MPQKIQPSFGKGEIAPSLYGRVDTEMYDVALKTARNLVIHTHGGASNRGGLRFRGPAMSMADRSFLVPFHFNNEDKYILEFGNLRMRVIRSSSHVTELPLIIQSITNALPGVVTSTSHGLGTGDEVFISNVVGMAELNGRRFVVGSNTVDTISLVDVFTGADVDTRTYDNYVSNGLLAKIYEITSPYILDHLPDVKYVQSADVMTMVHPDYPVQELSRRDHDDWTFSIPTFAPHTAFPTNVDITVGDVGDARARYKVTAVGDDESLPGSSADSHTIFNITAISLANPGQVTTSTDHGFPTGARVFISGVVGTTQVNDIYFTVTSTGATTFTIGVDTSAYDAWESGGTVYRTFEALTVADPVVITVITHDLATNDEIEIQGVEVPVDLNGRRFLVDVLTANTFSLRDENGLLFETFTDGGWYLKTFAEIVLNNISGITKANPGVVTVAAGHGIQEGLIVKIAGVVGMTQVNDRQFTTGTIAATTIQLKNADTTSYGTYTSGGSLWQNNTARNTVTWNAVADVDSYRIYKEDNGRYGFVGSTDALSFVEDNILPDTLDGPPSLRNPFFGLDNQPGSVGLFQQRRVFGGSRNSPDTSFYSDIGAPSNFSVHTPVQDDDAITIAMASQQVNEIRHFVPLQSLIILTSGGEWEATAGPDSSFTPTGVKQQPQTYYGCSHRRPLISGSTIIFAEGSDANVRTLSYSFQNDSFSGSDVGVLAPHLLYTNTIKDWAIAGNPDNRIHIVRDDGQALTVTFDEEQNVTAWTHWDTDGFFESVASLRRGTGEHHDAVFYCVNRNIGGNDVRFIEEWDQSSFIDVEDCFFVDGGATYDDPHAITAISVGLLGEVVVTCPGLGLSDGDEVDINGIEWTPVFDDNFNQTNPAQLEGRFVAINTGGDAFTIEGVDGTDWKTYVRGGTGRRPVTRIAGFDFLAGETNLVGLLDGNTVSDLSVGSDGVITLPHPTSRAHIGLRYIADLETLDIELSGTATIQSYQKKINFVTVKFERTRGLLIGPNSNHMFEMKQRDAEVYGAPTDLLTGNTAPIFLESAWNSNGRIFLRQRYPLPFTVLAIVPNFEIGTREDNS